MNRFSHSPLPQRKPSRSRAGFTLIELIAVMGIIVALALVVAGGYTGISRAISQGQASRQVRDALLLARQTACVNGATVYLYVLSEDEFVICRKIGTSSGAGSGKASYQSGKDPLFKKDAYYFFDYYTDLSGFVNQVDRSSEESGQGSGGNKSKYEGSDLSGRTEVYDLSGNEAQYGILRGVESNSDNSNGNVGFGWTLYWQPVSTSSGSDFFKEGHDYGVALHPVRSLPKGYVFLNKPGFCIYFDPTGTAGPGNGTQTLTMAEYALKNDAQNQHKVTVSHSGRIRIEDSQK